MPSTTELQQRAERLFAEAKDLSKAATEAGLKATAAWAEWEKVELAWRTAVVEAAARGEGIPLIKV